MEAARGKDDPVVPKYACCSLLSLFQQCVCARKREGSGEGKGGRQKSFC